MSDVTFASIAGRGALPNSMLIIKLLNHNISRNDESVKKIFIAKIISLL
ncbi:MAG: hypothetical protein IKI08_00505 [Selenomonadaceae bacterium]|nr:hypothetical protein [Selenomonadaceae bacterium]